MTDLTPAEELRTAAMKIRGRVASATPGICPHWTHMAVRHIARNCDIECDHDEHRTLDQPTWDRYEDAPYIALMQNPDLGVALADWLDALAAMATACPEMAHDHDRPACDDYACDVMGRGIAVARQILGEQP